LTAGWLMSEQASGQVTGVRDTWALVLVWVSTVTGSAYGLTSRHSEPGRVTS